MQHQEAGKRPPATNPGPIPDQPPDPGTVAAKLFEVFPDAVVLVDETGVIRYVNRAGVVLVGAGAPGEVVGHPVWRFVPPADLAQARASEERLRRGRIVAAAEQRLVRLDGEVVPVEASSVPLTYQDRPAVLVTVRDLRGRKTIERALSASQDLFVKAFRLGPAASSISRLDDGVFVDVNQQFLELTGFRREEVIGRSATDLNLWLDPGVRLRLRDAVREHGAAHHVELTVRRRDGEIREVISSIQRIEVGGQACALAISIDVSERNRAAQAERESRSLFDKIFEASPAPIAITRVSGGSLIEVNDAWCRFTGYTRAEALGHTTSELGLWADGSPHDAVLQAWHARAPLSDLEIQVRRKSGEVRVALASMQELQVEGEQCLLSVLVDITERKLTENSLREAKEHAEGMARLKSTFLTNLTHEIRTPLTVILGFTSILRQGVRKEYVRFVQLIERSGRRLLLMLDSMLDLAQLEAGTLRVEQRPYSLGDVLQSVVQSVRPLAEDKGLYLDYRVPARRASARLDHAVLTRVLNNVLDNAIKFTESGGIEVQLDERDDGAYVRIKDTGIGIDEAYLPYVFEPFSQESTGLERTHQGSGLGLSVSRRLIELMGGRIEVESKKGKGSIFTIILPREV